LPKAVIEPHNYKEISGRGGSTLLIWDAAINPPGGISSGMLWRATSTEDLPNYEVISKWIENNADDIREEYLRWVSELGKYSIRERSLAEHLELGNGASFWWLTLMAEKCNFTKSQHIDEVIKLIGLKSWLIANPFSDFHLVTDRKTFAKQFRKWCKNNNFTCRVSYNKNQDASNTLSTKFALRNIIPSSLLALFWISRHLVSRWPLRGTGLGKLKNSASKISFFSYLFNTAKVDVYENQFSSIYWGPLIDLMDRTGLFVNWFHIYVSSESLPNARSAARYLNALNHDTGNAHVTLESFLCWRVIWRTLVCWLSLCITSIYLKSTVFRFEYAGIRFDTFFKKDWAASFFGQHCAQSLLNHFLLDAAMEYAPHQVKGIYLMENQAWEYSLIKHWKAHSHGTIVGFPHSTVRFWDMRYFIDEQMLSNRDLSRSGAPAIPDHVAANGPNTRASLMRGGWPLELLVDVEALRFMYLNQAAAKVSCSDEVNSHVGLLVLGDYVSESTKKLLAVLRDSAGNLTDDMFVTIKPHPNCPVTANDANFGIPVRIASDDMENLLATNDIAFTSNLTSAAVDAYCYGLKVISLNEGHCLNLSPLREVAGVEYVSDYKEFKAAMKRAVASVKKDGREPVTGFFRLDPSLSRWKLLVGI